MPSVVERQDVPAQDRTCPSCGAGLVRAGYKVSWLYEIDWKVLARNLRRQRYCPITDLHQRDDLVPKLLRVGSHIGMFAHRLGPPCPRPLRRATSAYQAISGVHENAATPVAGPPPAASGIRLRIEGRLSMQNVSGTFLRRTAAISSHWKFIFRSRSAPKSASPVPI